VGPTDEVGDVFARYVSLTLKAVGLIFIFRSCVQHPVAVLGWDSNDPGLQAKPSGSACTCREGTCVVHISASFLTADHTASRGERYVYLLAAAPGTSSELLGANRRERANHDKRYRRRGRRSGEGCHNDRDYYDENCNAGRSRRCLIEEKFPF